MSLSLKHIFTKPLHERILDGEESAFHSLVDEFGAYVYKVCFNILKDQMESEEAAQDAMLKVVHKIADYNGTASFKTWIHTIAYRTALDYYRKRKRFENVDDQYGLASSYNSEDGVIKKEMDDQVAAILSILDPDDEQLIRLFYLEEMSIKELATLLEMSESNIKVRLFRIRKWLATKINPKLMVYDSFR